MRRPHRILVCVSPFLALGFAYAQGTPLGRVSDPKKPERVGYTVTTEGGIDGPQSVFIPEKPRRQPVAPGTSPGPAEVRPPQDPAYLAKGSRREPGRPEGGEQPFYMSRTESDVPDAALNKLHHKEDHLSQRYLENEKSDLGSRRYDRKGSVNFERWDRGSESVERKKSEAVDMNSRFATERVAKEQVNFDRVDFGSYSRSREKADIKNVDERFARDFAPGLSGAEKRSTFSNRMTEGYSLLSRVSMQDINRYQYRRNRSDEKGALPVAKPGSEATPMPAGVR